MTDQDCFPDMDSCRQYAVRGCLGCLVAALILIAVLALVTEVVAHLV